MENADHTRYTASDIQRYHEGGLSPADRHALEKAALEDPFLADALDGLALAPTAGADLAALRTSLAQRTQQPRRGIVLLYRQYKGAFRIAAAVLLIAAAGWIATTLTIDRKQPLAEVPTSKTAPAAAVADSVPASVDSAAVSSDVAQAETSASAPVVAPTDRQRERATARAWAQARAASKAAADDTLSVLMTMNQHASMNNGLDRRLIQPQANATRTFTGRIVDTNGVAVPFASVSIAEQKLTTLADSRGDFTLSVPDTVATVTVSAAGYATNRVALANNSQNEVQLMPAGALNEVVVTAAARPRSKKAPVTKVEEGQLEPEDGWNRYNDYLAEHLKRPEKVEQKPVSGEVTLAFDVNDSGEPVNITVVKSLCAACDEQAIELLRRGPKWKSTKGKKGTIVIKF